MFVHLFAVILLCASGINTHYVVSSDLKKESPNATYTLIYPLDNCDPGQTECGKGCCPFPDGVCCLGKECCPKGQVCIPFVGMCMAIETETESGKPELVSTKATALIKVSEDCPSGTTECSKGRCCMYPDATCCSDAEHCCPNGYSCDLAQQTCVRQTKWYTVLKANDKLVKKSASKNPIKLCPGGSQKCPSYTSCCLNDNGSWGCCPKPSTYSENKVQDQNCCQSYFGYICCNFPSVCTYMGCM